MPPARKRGRAATPASESPPASPQAKSQKRARVPVAARSAKQRSIKTDDGRTYYAYFTLPANEDRPAMKISVEDLVMTRVDEDDEETRKLKLKYWVGQVAAIYEDTDGELKFTMRFFDQAAQWKYMNSDDQRLLRTFDKSFRKYEVLETDVCGESHIECILGKLEWCSTEEEAVTANSISNSSAYPLAVFSDRMVIRCGSDGKRRNDLSDSLWPAPASRRRQRVIVQCPESLHSIRASDTYYGEYDHVELISKNAPLFDKAVEALKLSVLLEHLPCRETETGVIREFIKTAVASTGTSGNVLYISGVPGTGKTASVLSVVKQLEKSMGKKSACGPFQFAYINSMKLNTPSDLFSQVLYEMDIKSRPLAGEKPWDQLNRIFSVNDPKRPVTVLLVDEIDYLVTKSQQVVYQLFDWPLLVHSKLVLITISNTMDLPERLMPRVASRLGLARLNYLPYHHEQIREVIVERLRGVKAEHLFSSAALQFVSMKVANSTGDIRKALHICRRAIEIRQGDVVTPTDANKAQYDLYSNPLVAVISGLSYFSRMVLIALCQEAKVGNTDSVSLAALWNRFDTVSNNFQPQNRIRQLNYSDFVRLLDELKRLAILSTMKGTIAIEQTGTNEVKGKYTAIAEEDSDGWGFIVSLNSVIDYSDVKHALVEGACDQVAQRLL
jgi:Cdc6-like AAA superfamily ATPase